MKKGPKMLLLNGIYTGLYSFERESPQTAIEPTYGESEKRIKEMEREVLVREQKGDALRQLIRLSETGGIAR